MLGQCRIPLRNMRRSDGEVTAKTGLLKLFSHSPSAFSFFSSSFKQSSVEFLLFHWSLLLLLLRIRWLREQKKTKNIFFHKYANNVDCVLLSLRQPSRLQRRKKYNHFLCKQRQCTRHESHGLGHTDLRFCVQFLSHRKKRCPCNSSIGVQMALKTMPNAVFFSPHRECIHRLLLWRRNLWCF